MPLALRAFEHWRVQYRHTWRGTAVAGFVNPLLFLTAMGVGLGAFVDATPGGTALPGGDYLAYIGPGLLAATAVQSAAFDSTYPVLGSIKWDRVYHAMLATPLGVRDVLLGHLGWVAARLTVVCAAFFVVLVAFGAVASPWGVLAVPVGAATGVAVAAPIFALAASIERDSAFALVFRFGILPMMLFSGTFFPVDQLPPLVRPLAWLSPLFHGVELCRGLTLGELPSLLSVLHLGYLAVWVLGGGWLALRAFRRRLVV